MININDLNAECTMYSHLCVNINIRQVQGFPKNDARFSKSKNIPKLLSDERDQLLTFHQWGGFLGKPVI